MALCPHRRSGLDRPPHLLLSLEIAPDYYSYGMGFWCAAPALMALYRQRIDADPKPLEKLVRRFDRQQTFRLTGPEYARSKGQVSDLLRPWYQKKSLSLQCEPR